MRFAMALAIGPMMVSDGEYGPGTEASLESYPQVIHIGHYGHRPGEPIVCRVIHNYIHPQKVIHTPPGSMGAAGGYLSTIHQLLLLCCTCHLKRTLLMGLISHQSLLTSVSRKSPSASNLPGDA